MSDMQLVAVNALQNYELVFKTGGNPRVTGKFSTTGNMPNLPKHIRSLGIHPLEYYAAQECIARRTENDTTISVYRILSPSGMTTGFLNDEKQFVYLLTEIISSTQITYVQYQLDREDYDRRNILALPEFAT